jgi:SPW repeat
MAARKFLRSHRSWEDWLGIGLGLVIMLAPWIVSETSNQAIVMNAAVAGIAVLLFAELDLVQFRSWAEFGQLLCGFWVVASPFILGYAASGMLRVWHIVAGLFVVGLGALELWQQRNEGT